MLKRLVKRKCRKVWKPALCRSLNLRCILTAFTQSLVNRLFQEVDLPEQNLKLRPQKVFCTTKQPCLKDWLKGNFDFPKNLKHYQDLYKIPMSVRATNLLIDCLPKPLASYIENILEDTAIFHGTNYTVYPYRKIQNIISIYDLSCIRYPEYVDSVVEQYAKILILKVISDRHFRQDLIDKGKTRAKLFSWENTAKKTLEAYRSIL